MMGSRGDPVSARWPAPLLNLWLGFGGEGKESADRLRREVASLGEGAPFDPASLEGLPDPARRYLRRAIAPGTKLAKSVDLQMTGEIRLKPGGEPFPIVADQILAPPVGFVWNARARRGMMRIRGFDRYGGERGEMRWWLWGLLPVMSAEGEDVTRSAAGRLGMEAVLLPSSLVPGGGAIWEPATDTSARFRMRIGTEWVDSTLDVDGEGRPVRVSARRWSERAGPGYDLFVVEMSGEIESGGVRIPREMTAGWRLGASDEFRFYKATLQQARFG